MIISHVKKKQKKEKKIINKASTSLPSIAKQDKKKKVDFYELRCMKYINRVKDIKKGGKFCTEDWDKWIRKICTHSVLKKRMSFLPFVFCNFPSILNLAGYKHCFFVHNINCSYLCFIWLHKSRNPNAKCWRFWRFWITTSCVCLCINLKIFIWKLNKIKWKRQMLNFFFWKDKAFTLVTDCKHHKSV